MGPVYGPHDGDDTLAQFLANTYSRKFAGDADALTKVQGMVDAYRRVCAVTDVDGLMECTLSRHRAALARALSEHEVPGVCGIILKYLGEKGTPHKPPGARARCPPRLACCHLPPACHLRATCVAG